MGKKTELELIPSRVARGAAWLDETSPGWESKIDLGVLDIQQINVCVCGQTVGWYSDERTALGHRKTFRRGFGIDRTSLYGQQIPDSLYWHELNAAWVSLVKERFNTGAFSDS